MHYKIRLSSFFNHQRQKTCSLWLSFHAPVLEPTNEKHRTPVEHQPKYECTPVGHSDKDECSRPAGPCSRGKSLTARRMARLAHAGDRSTAGRRARQRLRWWHGRNNPLEVGRPLLCLIHILLRALAIRLVLRRFLNLWLKITPRLQQGPTEVLRNLVREIVVAPPTCSRTICPCWRGTSRRGPG